MKLQTTENKLLFMAHSVNPLLIFPCTIKSRSSLLAPADPSGPGKRALKQLWCGMANGVYNFFIVKTLFVSKCTMLLVVSSICRMNKN